ncbi:MAG: PspA-associated protein PspAB [Marmoricola sp.]
MGLLDVLRGRSRQTRPNLDNLFALPGAAITLQSGLGLVPTGTGSVCFRSTEGAAMAGTEAEVIALIEADGGPTVERTTDGFGFTWLVVTGDPTDLSGVVTDLHAVNTALENQGFGSGLLCSMVTFAEAAPSGARRTALVYLYKQGTFYPFAPTGGRQRDALLERQVRDAVENDLRIEPEASRWLPLWGAPGLAQ